ncbi:hypothetical protein KC19_4G057700 [Ceratodon purpureus]|uniref:Uncharacterized protein n=1 Tax=Ceratodon purpureus TaxID=3225 RepID=A0A8T0I612_CERPU|nr:hypothetical protein KC19_4G057700 [Ceratodon purpureus]
MSKFRGLFSVTALQWKAQVDKLSSVEVLLLSGWLFFTVVRRWCSAIADTCFFWAVTVGDDTELVEEDVDVVEQPIPVVHRGSTSGARESTEECWRQYFANPEYWWDNRGGKINTRAPDFKHKVTRKALWIDSYYTPHWVRIKLDEKP